MISGQAANDDIEMVNIMREQNKSFGMAPKFKNDNPTRMFKGNQDSDSDGVDSEDAANFKDWFFKPSITCGSLFIAATEDKVEDYER